MKRLDDADLLGDKSVREAAVEFNAMLEGLANAELRGYVFRNLPEDDEEQAWHNALATVINGFSDSPQRHSATTANKPTSRDRLFRPTEGTVDSGVIP